MGSIDGRTIMLRRTKYVCVSMIQKTPWVKNLKKTKNLTKNKQSDCSCIKHSPRIISAAKPKIANQHKCTKWISQSFEQKPNSILSWLWASTPIFHCNCTKQSTVRPCRHQALSHVTWLRLCYITSTRTTRVEKGSNKNYKTSNSRSTVFALIWNNSMMLHLNKCTKSIINCI